ncbi:MULTISPECIES: hypothetical protein [Arthrobacter]|uniref:hypothetical protein n=1 Tax=Arthrobacter TaxID=1663 RepID=UPI0014048D84|nr:MULTISPECIES: hypothetical protein [Arthrobacter]MBT8163276.1 hypothetical protein [Arthrobacter sp. GN70]
MSWGVVEADVDESGEDLGLLPVFLQAQGPDCIEAKNNCHMADLAVIGYAKNLLARTC